MTLIRFNHRHLIVCCLIVCLLKGIDSTTYHQYSSTIGPTNETNYQNSSAISLYNQFKSSSPSSPSAIDVDTSSATPNNNQTLITSHDKSERLRNESTISIPKGSPINLSTNYTVDTVNSTDNLTTINVPINLGATLTSNSSIDLSTSTISSEEVMMITKSDTSIINSTLDHNYHSDNDSVNGEDNQLRIKLNDTDEGESPRGQKSLINVTSDQHKLINGTGNGQIDHDGGTTSTQSSINLTTTEGTIDGGHHEPTKWTVNPKSDPSPHDNDYPRGKLQQHHQDRIDQQQDVAVQLPVSSTDDDEDSDSDSTGNGVNVGPTGGIDVNGESDLYLVSSRRKCEPSRSSSINWDSVDASLMASKPCPSPYIGMAYRACYSMGHWDTPDLTECRLPHLREIQNLIFYHVHKHLVDGLYPLAEELNRLLLSTSIRMLSPMDKLDALDSLNSILKAKVRIKLDEDEDRDHIFIKSLVSSSEQLLTQVPLTFLVETEKNALLTTKSAETVFGLKSLSESLLRTLIVFCNDGTIRRIKSFNTNTKNIAITLTHITPFGDRISLLHPESNSGLDSGEINSEVQNNSAPLNRPKAHIFLDDLRRYGIGISEICLHSLGTDFNTDSLDLISDLIVISVVPPISIEVNFERVPQVEIDFNLDQNQIKSSSDNLICGKLKSPRELWSHKECQMIFRNSSFIRCSCSELGVFGIIHVKSSPSQHSYNHHHNQCHFNPFPLYLSSGFSLILILVTMGGQVSTIVTCQNHWKSSYILLNLLTSLALIEIIFLFGAPFQSSSSSPSSTTFPYQQLMPSSSHLILSQYWTPCKVTSIILHYLHLVAAFTMLSFSIYLFNKLWRFHDDMNMVTEGHHSHDTSCYGDTIGSTTILPITVTTHTYPSANHNNNQQLSESIQSSSSSNHNQFHQHYHSHYQTRQQHQHQHQQQQPIQRSQSLSASSSYNSLPYSFSSSPTAPSSSSSDSCENALITWNQPNLHKEPESRHIVHLLLFTWTAPLLCVVSSNLINPLGYETKRYCWMSIEGGMMFSFIVPVSILIMSNTVTMLLILKRFFAHKPITHKIEIERVEPALRSGVSLLPFFAVNWFLGVLALEDTATDIFQYLFAFSNLIQHFLVFLFHCYQRPEICQRFSMYFAHANGNPLGKSSSKSKRSYWCSGHCSTVPLLIYSDDGSARLHENCFDDPNVEASRFKDQ